MFRWLSTHPKAETIFYSCVWLFFMAFSMHDALTMPNGWAKWIYLAAQVAFVAAYVRVWIVYPTMPGDDYRVPRGMYLTLVGMFVLEVAIVVLGRSPTTQVAIYIAAIIAYALPRRQGMICAALLIVGQIPVYGWTIGVGKLEPRYVGILLIFLLVMLAVFYGASSLLISHRDLRISHQTVRQLTQAQERERISSDLHDVLGQSLTAIALKSQLAAKLLSMDEAKTRQRAADEVDAIRDLAATALADMRSVVRDARKLSVEEEILAARELLLAADVTLVVTGEDFIGEQDQQRAAAHVVREATANIVHHAFATRCEIHTWADGVRIADDGIEQRSKQTIERAGTGLKALSARVAEAGGRLEYGRDRKGWQVVATFERGSGRK